MRYAVAAAFLALLPASTFASAIPAMAQSGQTYSANLPTGAGEASGPRSGTVEAMQCLFGISEVRPKCLRLFQGRAQKAAMPWGYRLDRDPERGHFISSTYWGRATESNIFDVKVMRDWPVKDMDIFDVKFDNHEYTFYVSPADADGKISAFKVWDYAPHDPAQLSGMRG